jgi:hypothetical protein
MTNEGLPGAVNLPRLADEFYRSARWLRIFTRTRMVLDWQAVIA